MPCLSFVGSKEKEENEIQRHLSCPDILLVKSPFLLAADVSCPMVHWRSPVSLILHVPTFLWYGSSLVSGCDKTVPKRPLCFGKGGQFAPTPHGRHFYMPCLSQNRPFHPWNDSQSCKWVKRAHFGFTTKHPSIEWVCFTVRSSDNHASIRTFVLSHWGPLSILHSSHFQVPLSWPCLPSCHFKKRAFRNHQRCQNESLTLLGKQ